MKKSLFAAAALATLAVSSNAMALDTSCALRTIFVDAFVGVGVSSCGGCAASFLTLGTISFLPLGVSSSALACDYLGTWYSAWNPNDAAVCVVHELRTAFAPSCIVNELVDVTTTVTTDLGCADGCAASCVGFNLKGEPFAGVSLALSEGPGVLFGVAVFPTIGIPQIYPVRIA
jgi:hypothetical protein